MPNLAGDDRVEKRFRVAREGQTVDGRELSREEIQQMSETYNPEHYAGRINIEHFAGWSPEPPFNAYGDIIKVEAVEENGKLCLYNTISALPNFIKMNKLGQKIYPSIEFYRNFAGTGKAYQVGLGLTDTPASLGTQAIKFSSNNFTSQTQPDKEIFMTTEVQQDNNKSLLEQIKDLMTPQPKPKKADEQDFQSTIGEAIVTAFKMITELATQVAELKSVNDKSSAQSNNSTASTTVVPASSAQTSEVPITQTNKPSEPKPNDTAPDFQQQLTQIQQTLQTLATTPVNQPPPAVGGNNVATPY